MQKLFALAIAATFAATSMSALAQTPTSKSGTTTSGGAEGSGTTKGSSGVGTGSTGSDSMNSGTTSDSTATGSSTGLPANSTVTTGGAIDGQQPAGNNRPDSAIKDKSGVVGGKN